jgi:NAD(P)-dependent dehydrogenase (short-subunit alcohol dehydrogenase family)
MKDSLARLRPLPRVRSGSSTFDDRRRFRSNAEPSPAAKLYVAAARAVLSHMKSLGWGRIICISSVAGRSGKAFIGTLPYAGAKGAVIAY